MQRKLDIGESTSVTVIAREYYSATYIEVNAEEMYEFSCDPHDNWKDWFIPSNANGFRNWILHNKYKRLRGVKCFKLCGTIGQNEDDHFAIGTKKTWISPRSGLLYFFANDHSKKKYYRNNRGSVELKIERKR